MALTPQWLDELRARTTLSSVIMRTTKLIRAGREWKACCPFHNENTPSFYVNDEKHFYHCFGCGAHGDAIRWMTEQRGLAFMDAVKELAALASMEVPAPDPRAAKAAEQRATLHDVTGAAQAWYEESLKGDEAAHARAYLKSRGFDAHTLTRFGFGYAPNRRDGVKKTLTQFDERMLVEAGMLITVEDKAPYDRFRDRLTIPIHDARGRVIGFAARILDKDKKDAPKYLNSPDTPLFDKGRTLFSLHRAAPAARKAGRIVVVEGQMDVVAMAAAGIEETVAPMGTALTETQLELLWRQAEKPILCFDGDNAGQKAAMRAVARALPLLKPGHSLQFVTLPKGMDPDDVVKREGRAGMERLLGQPQSLLDWVWEREKAAGPVVSPEDKAALKARLIEHAEAIQHPDIRSLYRRDWLERFSAFAFPPREQRDRSAPRPQHGKRWGQLTVGPLAPGTVERHKRAANGSAREGLALAVVAGFARNPGEIGRHAEALLDLAAAEPDLAKAIDALLDRPRGIGVGGVEAGGAHPISPLGIPLPPPDQAHYSFLMEGADPSMAREDLAEAMALLVEWPALEHAIEAATARWDTDPDGTVAELGRLTKRKLELRARLGQMARKRAASVALDDERSDAGAAPGERQGTG